MNQPASRQTTREYLPGSLQQGMKSYAERRKPPRWQIGASHERSPRGDALGRWRGMRPAPVPVQGALWPLRYVERDPATLWHRCATCGLPGRQTDMDDLGRGNWRHKPESAGELCARLQVEAKEEA